MVRTLHHADLSAVLRLEEAVFSTPWQRITFQNLLRRTDTDLLAAEADGELAGYAVCWTVIDQAELGNLAVAESFRGAGIGRALLSEALERVCARGAGECFLEVRVSNTAARCLYEAAGFVVAGERRGYYTRPKEDALVMRVKLGGPAADACIEQPEPGGRNA